MLRIATMIALASLTLPTPAAAFLWPWQQLARHHHARRAPAAASTPPNCDQIREAERTLTPDRLDRTLQGLKPSERAAAAKCEAEP